ncbi:glycosyltransferase family 22 protein [Corynascus similis CBS 632.67]
MASKSAQSGAKPTADAPDSAPSAKKHSTSTTSGTSFFDTLLAALIPGLILLHLVVAPYTKVEESFTIQAAHDVLVYGTPTSDVYRKLSSTYDHFTFPGAVPRTFIGPVLLAGLAQPIVDLVGFQHAQFVVRAILGLFNAACLLVFARNLRRAYGVGTARWYLLLQASQFHVIFYASRTLPNMFAFGLTTLAFAFLLPHPTNPKRTVYRQRLSITFLVFAAAIFRAEVALLLATTVLHQLLIPALSLDRVVFPFAVSFLTALAVSVPVDTYFWQTWPPRPTWPELEAFVFNVVRGGASEWGVSPWHWYLTSALPRLLLNPLTYAVLLPVALFSSSPALAAAARRLVAAPAAFVALYSAQPHKETRFVLYVVPPLTAAAALAADALFKQRRRKTIPAVIATLALVASVLASFAASTAMLAVSALNYPGGEALAHLRALVVAASGTPAVDASVQGGGGGVMGPAEVVSVHADVLACMTGVTLFGTNANVGSAAGVAAAAVTTLLPSSGASGSSDDDGAGTVMVNQQRVGTGDENGVRILVDKTEDDALLSSDDFWTQFDYLLVEDREKVIGGAWETVGVVKGYGGIEVVKPGTQDEDNIDWKAPRVVGLGETVALWKRRVRDLTGGWWVGPRMLERIYILRRLKNKDAPRIRVVVDAK